MYVINEFQKDNSCSLNKDLNLWALEERQENPAAHYAFAVHQCGFVLFDPTLRDWCEAAVNENKLSVA